MTSAILGSVLPTELTNQLGAGGRFSKAPQTFRALKAIAKSGTSTELFFFSHILKMKEGSLHTRSFERIHFSVFKEVSSVYTPFLDTDDLKVALRARKLSRAFEKLAPGHVARIVSKDG